MSPTWFDIPAIIHDSTRRRSCNGRSLTSRYVAQFGPHGPGTLFASTTVECADGREDVVNRAHAVKLTYDNFLRFPDDGKRHELIDGVHYVTASPNLKHQVILGNLHLLIASWLESHRVGRVFLSRFDVLFSQFDVVEPDLLFISSARLDAILTPQHVRGTPDLVVEIASKSTRRRDETIKRELYERAAVLEYWVIDPVADAVRLHRYSGERFGPVEEFRLGDTLRTPLLPGLDLPLARIFRDT